MGSEGVSKVRERRGSHKRYETGKKDLVGRSEEGRSENHRKMPKEED